MAGYLVSSEEKEFALHDRSTDHSTKLITLESIALVRKCVSSIEDFVPHEFKKRAVKIIRARLGYDIDGATVMLPMPPSLRRSAYEARLGPASGAPDRRPLSLRYRTSTRP